MIRESKYNNDNPANAKKNIFLVKIKNAIKNYIYSKQELKKYYDFTYHTQEHDLGLILDECIERVKFGKLMNRPNYYLNQHLMMHFKNYKKGKY